MTKREVPQRPVFIELPNHIPAPPGYWDLFVTCTGEEDGTDPGVLRYTVPGELLPHLREMMPSITFDDATYARVLAEYEAEQRAAVRHAARGN